MTGISHGQSVKSINMDFIQETDTLTGGLPAEYGRLTGGAIIAVTKSGSNEFHGDVFGFDSSGGLRADPTFGAHVPGTSSSISNTSSLYDIGANAGGYILKDRLWFFGAYDRVKRTDQSIRELDLSAGLQPADRRIDPDRCSQNPMPRSSVWRSRPAS
jgi:hypothetical protein